MHGLMEKKNVYRVHCVCVSQFIKIAMTAMTGQKVWIFNARLIKKSFECGHTYFFMSIWILNYDRIGYIHT